MKPDLGMYLYENNSLWKQVKNTEITIMWENGQGVLLSPKEGIEITLMSYIPFICQSSEDVFCFTFRFLTSIPKRKVKNVLSEQSISFKMLEICQCYNSSDLAERYRPIKIALL